MRLPRRPTRVLRGRRPTLWTGAVAVAVLAVVTTIALAVVDVRGLLDEPTVSVPEAAGAGVLGRGDGPGRQASDALDDSVAADGAGLFGGQGNGRDYEVVVTITADGPFLVVLQDRTARAVGDSSQDGSSVTIRRTVEGPPPLTVVGAQIFPPGGTISCRTEVDGEVVDENSESGQLAIVGCTG